MAQSVSRFLALALLLTLFQLTSIQILAAPSSASDSVVDSQIEPTSWSRWTLMGGNYRDDPDLCTEMMTGGRAHMVALGVDNAVWWRQWNGSSWTNAVSLGGPFARPPAITCRHNRLDVFATDANGRIWWNNYRHATARWSGWSPVPITFPGWFASSGPAAVSRDANRITIFAFGHDSRLWSATLTDQSWGVWYQIGGLNSDARFTYSPDASWALGANGWEYIHIVARARNGNIYQLFRRPDILNEDLWGIWQNTGIRVYGGPEFTYSVRNPSRWDIFGRSLNGTLGHAWSASNGRWEDLGGNLAPGSAPASVWVRDQQQLLVVIRGTDGALYHRVFNR